MSVTLDTKGPLLKAAAGSVVLDCIDIAIARPTLDLLLEAFHTDHCTYPPVSTDQELTAGSEVSAYPPHRLLSRRLHLKLNRA